MHSRLVSNRYAAFMLASTIALTAAATAEPIKVGQAFPAFSGADLLVNEEISLARLKGKVVVVDFWATWCGPCVAEIPNVKAAYKKYHDKGLEIISVSLDDSASTCRNFVTSNQMNWRHICDGKGWQAALAQRFNITSIPAMFVIGRDGKVIAARVRGGELERAIEAGLSGSASANADSKETDTPEASAAKPEGKPAAKKPAASADEEKAERWLKLARSMREIKDYETSRSYYQMIIDNYPSSSQARTARDELELIVAKRTKK